LAVEIQAGRAEESSSVTIVVKDASIELRTESGKHVIKLEGVKEIVLRTSKMNLVVSLEVVTPNTTTPEKRKRLDTTKYIVRKMSEIRTYGRRIELGEYVLYLYDGRVYVDGCWQSDIMTYVLSVPLSEVLKIVELVKNGIDIGVAIRTVASKQQTLRVRRALSNACIERALSILVKDFIDGKLSLNLVTKET